MSLRQVSRAATGIAGLDEITCGGFPKGRTILVLGEPGAGKTVLSSQFLIKGIEKFGENGIFVSLKDSPVHYFQEMSCFGWDFPGWQKEGRFAFVDASPIRVSPGEEKIGKLTVGHQDFSLISLLELVRSRAKAISARRIVVDSLSMLELQYPGPPQRRKAILDIVEALAETGVTCILTTDWTSIGLEPFAALEDFLRFNIVQMEKQLFHGVVTMQTIQTGKTIQRIITVEKMRETKVDRQPRPYSITERGIEVFPREAIV